MASGSNIYSYTEEKSDPFGSGEKTWKIFSGHPSLGYKENRNHNEAALLFGIADMGFKVYFGTNYQENSQSDFILTSNPGRYYKSYEEQIGHINPGIVWGMTRALIPGRGIKPVVRVDLNFLRYNIKQEDYDATGKTAGMYVRRSENRFIPGLNLATDDFTLVRVNNVSLNIDLDYDIKVHFYDNEYSYLDANGKYKIKTLQGGKVGASTESSSEFSDINQIQNSLTPKINVRWSGDRLGLFAGLYLAMSADVETQTGKGLKPGSTDGSLVKSGFDVTTTVYSLNPEFNLAMQWAIVPERLFLNTGCAIRVFKITSSTEDKKSYAGDVEDETKKDKVINNEFGNASTNLYLGVTFNFTKNLALQAALGVDSNNSVNVFRSDARFSTNDPSDPNYRNLTGGLFNFANILVTLQF
jgi:hypothetical protein